MSDLELILLILAGYYLFECAHWVRPGTLLFVSHFGERHRLHDLFTRALLRNDHGGLLFGNLLPLGDSAACSPWPVSISPVGVCGYVGWSLTPEGRPEQTRRFVSFEEVKSFQVEGQRVLVNGQLLVTAASTAQANYLVALLNRLRDLPASGRSAAIEAELTKSLDPSALAPQIRQLRWQSLPLLLACLAMFSLLFVCFPLMLHLDLPIDFSTGLLLYFGLLGMVLLGFVSAAKRVGHEKVPIGRLMLMVLSPADALHARNHLFRGLLSGLHPLGVARALAPEDAFQSLAQRVVLDLCFPLPEADLPSDTESQQTIAWFSDRAWAALLQFLEQERFDWRALLEAPKAENERCRAYCPRCRGQYERSDGTCNRCAGIELRLLIADPAPVSWPRTLLEIPIPPQADPSPPTGSVAQENSRVTTMKQVAVGPKSKQKRKHR